MSAPLIVPCTLAHLREICRTMRAEDRAEVERLGLTLRHVLVNLWRDTIAPSAAIVEGEVAAVWGDAAPVLASDGAMWLFTSPAIERIPLAYFKECRREIARRLASRTRLLAHVPCDYKRSLRFFRMLGVSFGAPIDVSGHLYLLGSAERAPQ